MSGLGGTRTLVPSPSSIGVRGTEPLYYMMAPLTLFDEAP